ncbi:putative transmembrane anti-sigma factor [Kribbella flavida DSM 17836]|uniref:Putative transmembrane anti-sigma factor n=1 Tax=Kribbella flavida (strain DSM 17836 / JCM 10339 / NBRC 14399) TaxID=479435 RepID=D2PZW0_KRIFD|nr:zf-HC2 domain-containing protein [Kribbella flavida]ADB29958.1 putative transmembrane anti-sigma factor [Kribbella flavida DSM 17836]
MSDRFREWDAAYVLGALSAQERREYEEHLRTCAECSAEVAALQSVPDSLAMLPEDRALATLDPTPPDLLPGLARAVERDRRRRRFRVAGLVAATAATAAAIGAVVAGPLARDEPEGEYVVLAQTVASKLSADARLVEERWGTTIEISCRYDDLATPSERARGYDLYVTDRSGKSTLIANWTASPGTTVRPAATTKLHKSEIRALDIRSSDTGRILLAVQF